MALTLKAWLRETARRLRRPFGFLLRSTPPSTASNDNELELMDLDEVSRLAAVIAEIDRHLPENPEKDRRIAQVLEKTQQLALSITSTANKEQSSSSSTAASKSFELSPSLKPERCSTAPEICLWAGSMSFRRHFEDLARIVSRPTGNVPAGAVRKVAVMNFAYKSRWYRVEDNTNFNYPPGTTGRKVSMRKLPSGAKGLKLTGPWDTTFEEDLYVPRSGVMRKHENRPASGRWFYPRPSSLRNELR